MMSSFANSSVLFTWKQIKDNFDKLHGGELSAVKDCPIYNKQEPEVIRFTKVKK